jgi:hypothetical protein
VSAAQSRRNPPPIPTPKQEAPRAALEAKWMPLDWPWKLPTSSIKNYFGEEIGTTFLFTPAVSPPRQ